MDFKLSIAQEIVDGADGAALAIGRHDATFRSQPRWRFRRTPRWATYAFPCFKLSKALRKVAD